MLHRVVHHQHREQITYSARMARQHGYLPQWKPSPQPLAAYLALASENEELQQIIQMREF